MGQDDRLLRAWIEAARAEPARTGVFVDFDGTLAAIVDEPSAARPVDGAAEVLDALAARLALVAVVSGRPAAFLAEHLGGSGRTRLYGLYGLEWAVGGEIEVAPEGARWSAAVAAATEATRSALPAGTAVEPKGLTVTLHYRAVPGAAAEVGAVAERLAAELGLVAHHGKMSVELRPPVDVDKGTVIEELSVGLSNVFFAGDDRGDLPAFSALRRLRADGLTTLAVASGGAETPASVLDAADFAVDGPVAVVDMLRSVVRPSR